ncbi:hypothetical protein GQ44DRAFT_771584 [Phaeosphaeriaceae sp. PMI808]|nr:hypothetical protein GQ44DRAFT_771584 [Phaeosphaeriaceae sp. PMI808]
MYLATKIVTVACIFAVVQGHPRGNFQFGSLNPVGVVKRALYNLDDLSDQSHKDKLTQGLKDAVTVAAKALEKMDDDKYKPKLEYWFGDKNSDDNGRETIRQVYKNFVGENTDGTGSGMNGGVFVFTDDYWKPTDAQIPGVGADGTIPFCNIDKDGKTGTAYFKRTDDKKPAMHFCDKVWERTDLASLTADSCSKLGSVISTVVDQHYPRIGKDAVGSQIGDVVYDAYQCRALAANEDEEQQKKTIVNADTYVWFALEIAFTEICGKSFSGPRDKRDDDDTNQDWPDSDPETNDPNNGACDCNESGCTPDSPACCANGSC